MGKSKKSHNKQQAKHSVTKAGAAAAGKDKKGGMFKVKSIKANKSKYKTKAITSTLSRMTNQKNSKKPSATENNKVYSNIQDALHRSKVTNSSASSQPVPSNERRPATIQKEPVNMDEAMEQLASL